MIYKGICFPDRMFCNNLSESFLLLFCFSFACVFCGVVNMNSQMQTVFSFFIPPNSSGFLNYLMFHWIKCIVLQNSSKVLIVFVLFFQSLLFRYNTFSPDVVKKMPKADLVDEVQLFFNFTPFFFSPYEDVLLSLN